MSKTEDAVKPQGRPDGIVSDLQWRGLIQDHTDLDELRRLVGSAQTFYAGYDPTAPSLHLGNLQVIMLLARIARHGHRAIALAGGGTGLIGDPSGRSSERTLNDEAVVEDWTGKIREQLHAILSRTCDADKHVVFEDNIKWIGKLSAIELLRDIGKYFPMSAMLAKDSVASRLGGGLTYTEFSYMVLQAYDFFELNRRYDCMVQVGGSDQWGNIVAGIELLRRRAQRTVHGLTAPLIVKSDGSKFGKSAGGAVWLDAAMTSPFALYQHLVNTPDGDVLDLLARLTFIEKEELEGVASSTRERPGEREAQRRLASDVTELVHGRDGLSEALRLTELLFQKAPIPRGALDDAELAGVEVTRVDPGEQVMWSELAVRTGVASSRSEARRLVAQHGLGVDGDTLSEDGPVQGDVGVLRAIRRGKKTFALFRIDQR